MGKYHELPADKVNVRLLLRLTAEVDAFSNLVCTGSPDHCSEQAARMCATLLSSLYLHSGRMLRLSRFGLQRVKSKKGDASTVFGPKTIAAVPPSAGFMSIN
jgi:hypothetical protein